MSRATAALALLLAFAGCRGDAVKCDQACRNVFTLTYWERADAHITTKPVADQEQERSKLLAKFTNEIEQGVAGCVAQCQSANNDTMTDCMIAAKTSVIAKECFADD